MDALMLVVCYEASGPSTTTKRGYPSTCVTCGYQELVRDQRDPEDGWQIYLPYRRDVSQLGETHSP